MSANPRRGSVLSERRPCPQTPLAIQCSDCGTTYDEHHQRCLQHESQHHGSDFIAHTSLLVHRVTGLVNEKPPASTRVSIRWRLG
jgi:hypothetical protein